MTENEAINVLQLNKPFTASKEANNAIEMAIQALEEVQAYRAIGTVEELQDVYELCESLEEAVKVGNALVEELKKYQSIGTVEDFKALKEKAEPKKPYLYQNGLLDAKMWHCPVCKKEVISDWNRELENDYCHNCGQRLDWQ